MKRFTFLIPIFIILVASSLAHAKSPQDYQYKVVYIFDGDTFAATDGNIQFRVRIAAMDAPEKGQPYSKVATYRLKSMLLDKYVTIIPVGKGYDRYGRVLGKVLLDDNDVALEMIKEGLAVYYRPLCKDYPADKKKYNYDPSLYIKTESESRKSKKYMWSDKTAVLPCQYRKLK